MATLDTIGMDAKVNTELKVHFGKNCNADQKVSAYAILFLSELYLPVFGN